MIAAGVALLGATLGAGIAWLALRRRALKPGVAPLAGAFLVIGGAALAYVLAAPPLVEAWARDRARAELMAVPVYVVLDIHEPAVFDKLLAEYTLVVRDRSRLDIYTDIANSEIGTVATNRIAHASDAALLALMHDMLDKLQVLREKSPEDCYRYLFPRAAGRADLARWFDVESQQRTLALMAEVIRTAAEKPVDVPTRERVEGLLGPVINGMYAQFGESTALLSHAEDRDVNRKTVCTIATALYEKVMALPPADAAAVIRSMTQL